MSSTTPYATLLFEARGNVGYVTLNRPEAANALNWQMARDLMDVMLRCDDDPAIRAVVLTATGKMFCAGGDLKSFAAEQETMGAHVKEVTTYLHAAISAMARMDAPVIASINGIAAGAGMSMACACDIVIAAESARFTMAYTRAGLTPDGSSTYYLPRRVGLGRAMELTLTNRVLSAQDALAWGIVNRIAPDVELAAQTDALASELAAGPTGAFGAAKRLLWSGWNTTLETQMAAESWAIAAQSHTADAREGITAFLEKRAPRFTGK